MEKFNSIEEINNCLLDIEYGWCDIDQNIYKDPERGTKKKFVLSSPEEVLKAKVGTPFDLVELERACFKTLGIKINSYFMIYYEARRTYTHTFAVYEENERFYWVEASLDEYKGIHEYSSLYDLLTDIRAKFKVFYDIHNMDKDYLCIYKYKKPKYHINLKDFYKHCEAGENVII